MSTTEHIVAVTVFAGAKKENEEWESEAKARLFVREPAQHNLANTRVRELVAAHFGVPLASVQILTGHRSPKKKVQVHLAR